MTRDELNIAIENARTKLLRLVLCWLIAASLFKSRKDRVLPHRVGRWVSAQIFKAELAAHYLQIAVGMKNNNDDKPIDRVHPLTIGAVLMRLKAVKNSLIRLPDYQKRIISKPPIVPYLLVLHCVITSLRAPIIKVCVFSHKLMDSCRAPPKALKLISSLDLKKIATQSAGDDNSGCAVAFSVLKLCGKIIPQF